MRVLHVLNTSFFSGAENVVCQMIKMFENEIEMAYASPDGEIAKILMEKGIKFFPMKELSKAELDRVVKEYQPDILHGHDIKAGFFTSKYVKQRKVIHTIHGNDVRMRKLSVKSLLYKKAAKKADHIFWVSKSCLEQYKFYTEIQDKSSVLVNIIDANEAIKRGSEKADVFDVLYIGRLNYPKNPERFVDIMAKVVKEVPSVTSAMIGKGPKEDILHQMIATDDIEKQVKLLGFESNPLRYLSKAKVLVLTSDWEGTPMVALEAMALGIPIVSTPTDGMVDLIQDGENGFLSSDETELAIYVQRILQDEALFLKLQNNQREKSAIVNHIDNYKNAIRTVYENA